MPYKLNYLHHRSGFVTRKVGDAYMIVPTGPRMKEYKGVITVNETAAFLFDQIKEQRSTDELMNALHEEYPDIDPQTAFDAISAFVDQCSFANLLESETVDELDLTRDYFMSDAVVDELKAKYATPEMERLAKELEAEEAAVAAKADDPNEGATLFPETDTGADHDA
ncbi:hypothetical protein AGMMS49992_09340 [Clostridia bacterium]|nr:hypothetical protein AGMMS49992_09340 [Clostridia bacterium]